MKNKTLGLFLAAALLGQQLPAQGQTYELNLTDAIKSKVITEEFVGKDKEGNIYVSGIRPKLKMYLPLAVVNLVNMDVEKYIRKYDKNMQLVDDKEIISENPMIKQAQINGRVKFFSFMFIGSITERNMYLPSFMVDDKYYMIVQDNVPPRNKYFAAEVNLETGSVTKMTELLCLSKNKKDMDLKIDKFSIRFSPDSSHILFLATYQKDKSQKMGVAYSSAVFTRDMERVYTSNYTLPKASKTFTIKDAQLTNDGQILVLGRNYDKRQKENPGYVSVFTIDKGTPKPKETRLKFGAAYVDDVLLSLNDGEEPLVTGFYRNKRDNKGYDGMLYASLNENKEITNIQKKEFTVDFIASDHSARVAKKLAKKEKKGKDVKEDKDFALSEFIKTSDGGYMAIAENYSMRKRVTSTTRGSGSSATTTTRTDYIHAYDDLMVIKFDKDGNLQTMNKVAKATSYISYSPARMYERDYASFEYDGDMYLVFNDDAKMLDNVVRNDNFSVDNATYIVQVKPDGTLKKDVLMDKKQMSKCAFDPHKRLLKLADNRLAFIASGTGGIFKNSKYAKKTMMGSFTIKKG